MNKLKRTRFFSLGRKWIFTLALFLLVFAAASVVKVKAGTSDNVTGWLWGGSEEISDGNPTNGLSGYETGVGWISMNRTDCDTNNNGVMDVGDIGPSGCPAIGTNIADYGVNIPPSGNVTGNAWSERVGWIQFNPIAPYPNANCNPNPCPSDGATRNGDNLTGWARILSISQAGANAGGWEGWIKMGGIAQSGDAYGVKISEMKGVGGGGHTYAWSNELGAIDFGQAKYEDPCTLKFDSDSKTLNENGSGSAILSETGAARCQCKNVKIESTNAAVADGVNPITANFFADNKLDSANISFNTKSVGSDTYFPGIIRATSDDCGGALLDLSLLNVPACTLNCPSEIVVAPGQTKSVKSEIGITGETGCTASAIKCSESGTDAKGNIDVSDSCDVSATGSLRFGSSELTATAGTGSCTAPISVKGPGWIETNP